MASTSDNQLADKRLLARAEDALAACRERYLARFIGFLDERQAALLKAYMTANGKGVSWRLYGGHGEAQRVILGVFSEDYPDGDEMFPLTPMAFHYRYDKPLSHRDVLGALLSCGIVREKVGDIVCEADKAIAFLHDDVVAFIAQELHTIGRVGIRVEHPYTGVMPPLHRFEPLSGTVASARLDAVIKTLLGISREEAAMRVRNATVSIDHQIETSVSATVREGAILSVRQSGRFVVDELSQTTKKGRLVLKARKYV